MSLSKDLQKRASYLPAALPPKEYAGFSKYILRKVAWLLIALPFIGAVIAFSQ